MNRRGRAAVTSAQAEGLSMETDMTGQIASHRDAILNGVGLVSQLVDLRDARRRGDGDLQAAVQTWHAARDAWWEAVTALDARGVYAPLAIVARRFGLSPTEIDILLVALGPSVDPELLDRTVEARDGARALDTPLILGLLFHSVEERLDGHDLLCPTAPLVRHGLLLLHPVGSETNPHDIEVRPSEALTSFVLERPLLSGLIGQFCELVTPRHQWDDVILPDHQKELVWDLLAGQGEVHHKLDAWGYGPVMPSGRGMVLLFAGPPGTGKTAFAHAVAFRLGRPLLLVRTSRLLGTREPLLPVLQEIFRVASLSDAMTLIDDCEGLLQERNASFLALLESLEHHDGLLILATNLAPRIDFAMARRILVRVDFELPPPVLREQIWEVHLPEGVPVDSDVSISLLAATYEFTGATIRNTVLVALSRLARRGPDARLSQQDLRDAADTQLSAHLDDLAVRTRCDVGLDGLVLPSDELAQLREVLSACRHHDDVLNRWGFGRRLATGRGICVLFDGPPGTGKTFAAELIAGELKRPLYRVHIPQVVSKWVGETERNISEIFSRARASRAMLLFDEADSLFGRRVTSTQTANDRFANMEVNHLLQEIERYDGVTILTTNLFGNLDEALQRRIQFRVTFPFPEPAERARIWEILLPPEAPRGSDVDFVALGKRFELSGGHIKNALLRAAYMARGQGTSIGQQHFVTASIAESRSQGKLIREPVVAVPPVSPIDGEPGAGGAGLAESAE